MSTQIAVTMRPEERLASGDAQSALSSRSPAPSIEELHTRFGPAVHRLALGSTHNAQDADDICQDIWLRVHREYHTLETPDAARGWLFRVARRVCIDVARRPQRPNVTTDEALDLPGPVWAEPEPRAISSDARALRWEALAWLPERQQSVLLMQEMGACSYRELAERCETTVPAIEALVHRARKNLLRAHRAIESSQAERCKRARVVSEMAHTRHATAAIRVAAERHLTTCLRCALPAANKRGLGAWLGSVAKLAGDLVAKLGNGAGLAAPLPALVGTAALLLGRPETVQPAAPPELRVEMAVAARAPEAWPAPAPAVESVPAHPGTRTTALGEPAFGDETPVSPAPPAVAVPRSPEAPPRHAPAGRVPEPAAPDLRPEPSPAPPPTDTAVDPTPTTTPPPAGATNEVPPAPETTPPPTVASPVADGPAIPPPELPGALVVPLPPIGLPPIELPPLLELPPILGLPPIGELPSALPEVVDDLVDDVLDLLPPETRPDVTLPADGEPGEIVVPLPDPLDTVLPELEVPTLPELLPDWLEPTLGLLGG